MRIKVQGGTPQGGEASLCTTCRHATIIQGLSLQDRIVSCSRLSESDPRVPFPVRSCSGYSDRRHPTVHEMEDIAWILRTDSRSKAIGFVQGRELKPKHRYVLPGDWD
jgi:hypothetical protein